MPGAQRVKGRKLWRCLLYPRPLCAPQSPGRGRGCIIDNAYALYAGSRSPRSLIGFRVEAFYQSLELLSTHAIHLFPAVSGNNLAVMYICFKCQIPANLIQPKVN